MAQKKSDKDKKSKRSDPDSKPKKEKKSSSKPSGLAALCEEAMA